MLQRRRPVECWGAGATAVRLRVRGGVPRHPAGGSDTINPSLSPNSGLIAPRSAPFASFAEFVDHARRHPGALSYSSAAIGSHPHATMELLNRRLELDVLHVPDHGAAPALTDRVAGRVSGPMRCTPEDFPYPSVAPLARALVAHAPERLVWGSDWPHVNMRGRVMPNDGDLLDLMLDWAPAEAVRSRILSENARALYDIAG